MDLLDIAFRNARIDAQARAKKMQAKPRGRDKTCAERAKAANVRDALVKPKGWRCSHDRHVSFGELRPNKFVAQRPPAGILKN